MLSSFKSKIGNVYCPVYILELLTSVIREKTNFRLQPKNAANSKKFSSMVEKLSHEGQKRHLLGPFHLKDLAKLAILHNYKHHKLLFYQIEPGVTPILPSNIALLGRHRNPKQ